MDVLQMAGARAEETGPVPLRQARSRFERQYILYRLHRQPRKPRRHRPRAGHRADEPLPQDEAARHPGAAPAPA